MVARAEPVAEDGSWSKKGLPVGRYRLAVTTGDGAVWYNNDQVDLESGPKDLEIDIPMVRVHGSVSIGDEALAGKVALAHGRSQVRVVFETDEEGQFSGLFPSVVLEDAKWMADVVSSEPPVRRKLTGIEPRTATSSDLEFVLKLPAQTLEGSVVDERGNPRAAVVILMTPAQEAQAETAASFVDTRTNPSTGKFRITGLASGEYRVQAHGGSDGAKDQELVSDMVAVTISEKASAATILVLRDGISVQGRVVTPAGAAIPGVAVHAFPADSPDMLMRPLRTDASGGFVANVPRSTREIIINVEAEGVARTILGRPLPSEGRVLEVELNPAVGQLILDLGDASGDLGNLLIYHDGGFAPVRILASWSARNGGVMHLESARLDVPLMVPGHYSMCRVVGFREYAQFRSGVLPAGQCDEGDLPPGGELRLQAPKSKKRAVN
jgi:hypothetical protein